MTTDYIGNKPHLVLTAANDAIGWSDRMQITHDVAKSIKIRGRVAGSHQVEKLFQLGAKFFRFGNASLLDSCPSQGACEHGMSDLDHRPVTQVEPVRIGGQPLKRLTRCG